VVANRFFRRNDDDIEGEVMCDGDGGGGGGSDSSEASPRLQPCANGISDGGGNQERA